MTGVLGIVPEGLVRGVEDLEKREQVETMHTSVLFENSPGHLKRLVVTLTPVKKTIS